MNYTSYLTDLEQRKISVQEVAEKIGWKLSSLKRKLERDGYSLASFRKITNPEDEKRRLKKLLIEKYISESDFSQRIQELEDRRKEEKKYVCKDCDSSFIYSLS